MNPADAGPPPVQVITMHGWAGDGAAWAPWREAGEALGWHWVSGERGYGTLPPLLPRWGAKGRRVLITHSMGPHLLPPDLLKRAELVVLLAGFGRFLPPGREGRGLKIALEAMARELAEGPTEQEAEERARRLVRTFLAEAAAPDPVDLLPAGPADGGLPTAGRRRLRDDLGRLERSRGLPEGFPPEAKVLIVEAGADRIVLPETRRLLRLERPEAEVLHLAEAGHCLLRAPVLPPVFAWVEAELAS